MDYDDLYNDDYGCVPASSSGLLCAGMDTLALPVCAAFTFLACSP